MNNYYNHVCLWLKANKPDYILVRFHYLTDLPDEYYWYLEPWITLTAFYGLVLIPISKDTSLNFQRKVPYDSSNSQNPVRKGKYE